MVASEVDGSPSQPAVKAQEQVDVHRLLRQPDGLAKLLSKLDCAKAAQAVGHLAAHLHGATQIDAIGIIEQLAFLCDDEGRPGQSSMRCLSRSVAAFVADCMQFVDDDVEIVIIEFVSTVPLTYGFDFLCEVGAAQGLVLGRSDAEFSEAKQCAANFSAVEHAIKIWRHRAKRAVASGYVAEEGGIFLLLDGLVRFGVGAVDADAVAARSDDKQPAALVR